MKLHEDDQPTVTQSKALGMQVCVPGAWTDAEIEAYANRQTIAGTEKGWGIRRGENERVPCSARGDRGFVHVVLNC